MSILVLFDCIALALFIFPGCKFGSTLANRRGPGSDFIGRISNATSPKTNISSDLPFLYLAKRNPVTNKQFNLPLLTRHSVDIWAVTEILSIQILALLNMLLWRANTVAASLKQCSDSDSCCRGERSLSGCADMTNRALPYGTVSQPHKDIRNWCVWHGGVSSHPLFYLSLPSMTWLLTVIQFQGGFYLSQLLICQTVTVSKLDREEMYGSMCRPNSGFNKCRVHCLHGKTHPLNLIINNQISWRKRKCARFAAETSEISEN